MSKRDDLLSWARARLAQELGGPPAPRPVAVPWGSDVAATFVTLRWRGDGRLHGCIGSLEPRQPVVDDVERHVLAAAFDDPRSESALTLADLGDIAIDVSILSRLEPVSFADEASALAALRPGVDGVVFEHRGRRATFLPAMWSRLPGARDFMAALKHKAGLPEDFWSDDVRLWRYTVEEYAETHA